MTDSVGALKADPNPETRVPNPGFGLEYRQGIYGHGNS
jgi:hypothetical protein